MKIFITGICGFVGFNIAKFLKENIDNVEIFGIDNLSRRGSEYNLLLLKKLGVKFYYGDIRNSSDFEALGKANWVIDCAANPSVLAGLNSPSRQLVENNLYGTINILEYCKKYSAGLILLSTSRVYSVKRLKALKLKIKGDRFEPEFSERIKGFSKKGISEDFDTTPPLSLYGATKLSSEIMAMEYSSNFNFPLVINRCSVIAGRGQFGKIDQGIFSFWVYSCLLGKVPAYIGFGGRQVRDVVDVSDIAKLVYIQIKNYDKKKLLVYNIGGGQKANMSLREINNFCRDFFKKDFKPDIVKEERQNDVPYYVTDYSLAKKIWNWQPSFTAVEILENICIWAKENKQFIEKLNESSNF